MQVAVMTKPMSPSPTSSKEGTIQR
jgi:hypothetical protein